MQVEFAQSGMHSVWKYDSHGPISHVTEFSWITDKASILSNSRRWRPVLQAIGTDWFLQMLLWDAAIIEMCVIVVWFMDSGRKYSK